MILWNDHKNLEGKHAFLSASKNSWLNYDNDTLQLRYFNDFLAASGTTMHALVHDCILNRIKIHSRDKHLVDYVMYKSGIPKNCYDVDKLLENVVPFVNDAIGFRMSSEVILYYSKYCFGTADAISYDEKTRTLRIHDLKTGTTPAHIEQLYIYAALFFLEYKYNPETTNTILRIYQNGEILETIPDPKDIKKVMKAIIDDCVILAENYGGSR